LVFVYYILLSPPPSVLVFPHSILIHLLISIKDFNIKGPIQQSYTNILATTYNNTHNTTMATQANASAPAATHKYDQNFTQNVIDTCGPNTSPRFKEIFSSAVRHLHDFTREVDLTPEEWLEGVKFFNEVGKMWAESNGKRNEMHRMSDLVGLES
jgi:hypothetical protein